MLSWKREQQIDDDFDIYLIIFDQFIKIVSTNYNFYSDVVVFKDLIIFVISSCQS